MAATNDEVITTAGDLTLQDGKFEFIGPVTLSPIHDIAPVRIYEPCPEHPDIDEVLEVFDQAFCVPCIGVLLTTLMMMPLKRRE